MSNRSLTVAALKRAKPSRDRQGAVARKYVSELNEVVYFAIVSIGEGRGSDRRHHDVE
jgi:hypothetical protein